MQYVIQSPRVRISEKTEIMLQEKFDRFEKMFDRVMQCHLVLKKEKNGQQDYFIVEARLAVPGNDLYAREQAASFEIAAEEACQNLERQIRKHKEKLNKKAEVPVDRYVNDEELE